MQRRIVVISNPASGRRSEKHKLVAEAVSRIANERSIAVEFLSTSVPGESARTGRHLPGSGSDLALQAVTSGADLVVACGGDGTVGEVANGLVGTDTPLAVLPLGTGNDFCRTIGVSQSLDEAITTLFDGRPQPVDVGRCGEGYFLNVAGCGFDAQVAQRINAGFRFLSGTPAYVAATLSTLIKYRPIALRITIDGVSLETRVMLCAIANARTYGGGMKIAPQASLQDGLFDIILVEEVSKFEFLRAFPTVFKGNHLSHPKVKSFRGKQVKLESPSQIPLLADGEELHGSAMEFEVVPLALKVMVPRPMA